VAVVKKTLTPSPEQLAKLPLVEGQNTIVYRIGTTAELRAYIYMFRCQLGLGEIG
jgi:hypothetical protein